MARLNDEKITEAFTAHLEPGETLRHWAFGVKQPSILIMLPLFALAILPGVIATFMLTKNYLIGLTDRRFIVLTVKGITDATLKEVMEYGLDEVRAMEVKTSTGPLFTHIKITDPAKPFIAKFHRAFSKDNRAHAMAIAEAISSDA